MSSFYVKSYPAQSGGSYTPCNFRNLRYGIYANGISTDDYMLVEDASFNVDRAIYSCTMKTPTVVNCTMNIPANENSYGIYIDGGTDFVIEDNTLKSNSRTVGQFGIIVNNNAIENEIYNNVFEKLTVGFHAQGASHYTAHGACLTCNDFHENNIDISAIGVPGIATLQGSDAAPAFNLFSTDIPNSYDIYNDASKLKYFWYDEGIPDSRHRPIPISSSVTRVPVSDPDTILDCQSRYNNIGSVDSNNADITSLMIEQENINDTLNDFTDNGDTETLNSDVLYSVPSKSNDIYDELMSSPEYLSETVLQTSAQKEDVLNNAMITDIVVANPQGSKDQPTLDALNNRSINLSQNQWDQILAGQEVASDRESDQARLTQVMKQIHTHKMNIARINMESLPDSIKYSNAYNEVLQRSDIESRYFAAFSSLVRSCDTLYYQILSDIEPELTSQEEFDIHQNMIDLINLTKDYFAGNDSLFPSGSQQQSLMDIYSDGQYPGILAKNILTEFDLVTYDEPIDFAFPNKNTQSEWTPNIAIAENTDGKIYPNPVNDYLYVDIEIPDKQVTFEIKTTDGKVVKSGDISKSNNLIRIDSKDLSSGMYILTIFDRTNILFSEQFIK